MPYQIDGAIDASTLQATEFMKIAVVGESGIGKSWLSATAPEPWFWDFDGRLGSLSGKNVSGKSYIDFNRLAPSAWKNAEIDLAKFEDLKLHGEPIPQTYVCDSMQQMAKAAMQDALVMAAQNSKVCRKISVGATSYYVPGGFDAWQVEYEAIMNFVSRLFALGNVICNFHEAPEEAPESTQETPIFTGRLIVFPVRLKKLLPLFNDKWRLFNNNGKRMIYTNISDPKFTAASTLLVDPLEEPDISAMINKHKKRIGK